MAENSRDIFLRILGVAVFLVIHYAGKEGKETAKQQVFNYQSAAKAEVQLGAEPREGGMHFLAQAGSMTLEQLRFRNSIYPRDFQVLRRSKQGDVLGIASRDVQGEVNFVPSFLINYSPHPIKSPFLARTAVAQGVRYKTDQDFFGKPDVWMTAPQTLVHRYGDCDDHSVLLADWLIANGFDARIVLGYLKKSYHAWVVVIYQNEEYLLEATSRRISRTPPLARYKTDYKPDYMFNHEYFWVNTGTKLTTNYSSDKWDKRSVYVPISVGTAPQA